MAKTLGQQDAERELAKVLHAWSLRRGVNWVPDRAMRFAFEAGRLYGISLRGCCEERL